jgi:transketolase
LRVIPNIVVLRPGDANETAQAWSYALEYKEGPTALALSRQSIPVLDREIYSSAEGLKNGAYVLADMGEGKPEMILMASGSEVDLIVKAGERLAADGINTRLVSFPSWEIFRRQDQVYRDQVLPKKISARLAVEAGVSLGWREWVGDQGIVLAVDQYGASAPAGRIFEEYGLTVENVVKQAKKLIRKA